MSSMQKRRMLETLSDYYIKKGKIYESSLEYSRQTDTPYSIKEIKKVMGGWSMLFKYLDTDYPNLKKDIDKKDRGNLFGDKPVFPKSKIPKPPKPSMSKVTLTTGRNETNE